LEKEEFRLEIDKNEEEEEEEDVGRGDIKSGMLLVLLFIVNWLKGVGGEGGIFFEFLTFSENKGFLEEFEGEEFIF